MTRKSKRIVLDSDKELQAALKNPNATIHWNPDGTHCIEYQEAPEPPPLLKPVAKDESDAIGKVYQELVEYCAQQGLLFLDRGGLIDFCDLLQQFVPK